MCVLLAQRSAFHCKILCIGIDKAAVNRTIACNNAFAGKLFLLLAEIRAAMLHEHIQFDEGSLVKQLVDALTGCLFALRMLLVNTCLTAALHDMFFFACIKSIFS